MEYDKAMGLPSTFFLGTGTGRSLAYSLEDAGQWARKIMDQGFQVGSHAVAFMSQEAVEEEFRRFKRISGLQTFRYRLHNVGIEENAEPITRRYGKLFLRAGYSFSSNSYSIQNPFRVNGLWEFPIQVMDGCLFYRDSGIQNANLDQAKEMTLTRLREARKLGLRYFTVLFHDIYFNPAFGAIKGWYCWLTEFLKEEGFVFTDFKSSLEDLEG